MKYGDAVVLVLKTGDVTSRLNAIVLASSLHAPMTLDRKPVPDAEVCEHLDIAFPVASLVPDGGILKTRNMDEIFRPAYNVGPYVDGAAIGFELLPEVDDRINGSPREVFIAQFGEASETIARLRKDLFDSEEENQALETTVANLRAGWPSTAKAPVVDISKVQLPDANKQKDLDHQLGGGLHANDDGGDGSGDEGGQRDGGEAGGGKQNPPPPGP